MQNHEPSLPSKTVKSSACIQENKVHLATSSRLQMLKDRLHELREHIWSQNTYDHRVMITSLLHLPWHCYGSIKRNTVNSPFAPRAGPQALRAPCAWHPQARAKALQSSPCVLLWNKIKTHGTTGKSDKKMTWPFEFWYATMGFILSFCFCVRLCVRALRERVWQNGTPFSSSRSRSTLMPSPFCANLVLSTNSIRKFQGNNCLL